jgi:hypothetical protein
MFQEQSSEEHPIIGAMRQGFTMIAATSAMGGVPPAAVADLIAEVLWTVASQAAGVSQASVGSITVSRDDPTQRPAVVFNLSDKKEEP